jgi:aldehyde:ferredoxin oxidoreductase
MWHAVEPAGIDFERYAECVAYDEDRIAINDSIGTCIYWMNHYPYPPYRYGDAARLVSYATGMNMDEDELMKTARRVSNILKGLHLLSGWTKKDDTVPEEFFKEPPPAPKVVMNEKRLERMRLEYYKVRGWDDNGIPKQTTLHDLGIDYVHEELERKGILSGSG